MRAYKRTISALALVALAACGGSSDPGDLGRVGGTIQGLLGTGLVLQLNGGDDLRIAPGDTSFQFPIRLASGSAYVVTVSQAPTNPAQICTVSRGAGRIDAADVSDALVTCSTEAHQVRVTVTGLEGTGLVLSLNGQGALPITANGRATFPELVASGASYVVAVATQPTGPSQECTVEAADGTMGVADVENVVVSCTRASFRVIARVAGLIGTGLVLRLDSLEELSVQRNEDAAFARRVPSGGTYAVAVLSQPVAPVQTCEVAPATGTVGDGDAVVVVTCATVHGAVTTIAGSGVEGVADGPAMTAQFSYVLYLTTDPAGNLYMTDYGGNRIRKLSIDGQVTTLAGSGVAGFRDGPAAEAQFDRPTGIAVDGAGNVYVASLHRIRKISPAGTVSTFAGSETAGYLDGPGTTARFYYPYGLAVDGAGNVYVADRQNFRIRKVTPSGEVSTLAGSGAMVMQDGVGTQASFAGPAGMAIDRDGNLYVTEVGSACAVRKISPSGSVTTLAGGTGFDYVDAIGAAARFNGPSGVAVASDGRVFVGDSLNHVVREITPAGAVSTLAGSGAQGYLDGAGTAAMFKVPEGVALDPQGNLFVVDQNDRIRKIWR